jgi:hypothetical protein
MSATKNCPSPIGIIMVLFAANLNQKTTQTPLERLQAKIAVVSVGSLTPLQVSSTIPQGAQQAHATDGQRQSFSLPDKLISVHS